MLVQKKRVIKSRAALYGGLVRAERRAGAGAGAGAGAVAGAARLAISPHNAALEAFLLR